MEVANASLWISPPTNVEMDQLNPDPSNSSEVPSESCLSSFYLEFSFFSVVFRWIFLWSFGFLWQKWCSKKSVNPIWLNSKWNEPKNNPLVQCVAEVEQVDLQQACIKEWRKKYQDIVVHLQNYSSYALLSSKWWSTLFSFGEY